MTTTTRTEHVRILVGGLGYRNLRDGSVGPWVADALAGEARDGVEVEDVSYHPVGLSQNLQARVSEAVTGVISLDNTLIVCGALGGLPDDVRVVEIEPEDEGWGEGFSATVESRLPEVVEAVWSSTRP